MPKFNSQKGAIPVLFLLAALGLLIFLFISSTFDFKDKLFNKLFPKPPSHAADIKSVPDEILLKFKPGVPDEAKENIRNSHGIKKEDEIIQIGVERGKVPEQAKDKIIEALKNNPVIEYAEPNYIVKAQLLSNDPALSSQWSMTKIVAPPAWDVSTGSSLVVIAVLDTGVDTAHEDLKDILVGTPDSDDNGHGTQVSGLANASTNNSAGIASLCWSCKLLSVKVLDSTGSGSDAGVASGIVAATDNGAKVINLSLGSYATTQTMQDAINYAWNKGVVVVGASGNDNLTEPFYPAALDHVIAVGATTADDQKASFSNYGSWLDVLAPGLNVGTTKIGGYTGASGTSMSAPQVAALAGLIFSTNPGLTNQQVVDIIISTADDLGWGKRINAAKALQKATGTTAQLTPTPTPTSSSTPTPTPTPTPIQSGPTPAPSDTTPPTLSITNPVNNSTVKVNSTVNIIASATDNISISKVEFYVNNSLKCTSRVTPYTCSWKVPGKKNTQYTVTAKAYDTASNTQSASIKVIAN